MIFKILLTIGILSTILSFGYYLLGLMRLEPLFLTTIPLFLSILFTLNLILYRNSFKGLKRGNRRFIVK